MKISFLGGCDVDEYYILQGKYPKLGGKAFINDFGVRAGGMVANAAIVARSLNIDSYMIHELSSFEESSKVIIKEFEKYEVNTEGISFGKRKNKKCIIITENGERVIFVVKDNMKEADKISLSENQKRLLLSSDFIYSTISDLEYFQNIEKLLKEIKEHGLKIFIDLDANILKEEVKYLEYSDIVSVNEFGYGKIIDIGYDAKSLIKEFDLQYLLLTKGKLGAEVYTKTESFFHEAIDVKVKDTTGAGDTFNTSFLYSILSGFNASSAIRFASYAAASAITQEGPRKVLNKDEIVSLAGI